MLQPSHPVKVREVAPHPRPYTQWRVNMTAEVNRRDFLSGLGITVALGATWRRHAGRCHGRSATEPHASKRCSRKCCAGASRACITTARSSIQPCA